MQNKHWRRLVAGILFGATLPIIGCGSAETDPENTADLVLTNARVYTFRWSEPALDGTPATDAPWSDAGWRPDAQAVAIGDGRVLAIGSHEEISDWIGPETEQLDLAGATLIPGLVDSHTHVRGLGELEAAVNLVGIETEDEAIARVVARAAERDPGEWIIGRGWDEGAWANRYPTLEKLSDAVPDHPVILYSLHGFAIWGNALAFERAGIDRTTPDPSGGEILRFPDGRPNGIVLNRAGPILSAAVPPATDKQIEAYTLAGLERMARDGYTAVHEAGVSAADMAALERLAAKGELPIRVYAMLSARDEALCREWLQRGIDSGEDDLLAVRSVKAYYDGALGSRGARLLEDYADRPGHRGTSGDEYGFDEALVEEMMRAGFQVGIHAIGDAGNRESLDFIERVIDASPESQAARHRIEHAQEIHPDDIPRFAELDVIASMEPPHAVEDKRWAEDRLGPDRIHGAYAWRTLRKAGAHLTFNSDLSGSDHSIFYGLHAAITRRDKDQEPTDGWYPEERLTSEEALRAYTNWSAYAAHWEQHTGTIEPGRWADLTAFDIDPLELGESDPGAILGGRIVATVVAGRIVHQVP